MSAFLSPTYTSDIENVILSNNLNQVEPNNISAKTLKLLKKYISSQLAETNNISFSSGFFPLILKIAIIITRTWEEFQGWFLKINTQSQFKLTLEKDYNG